jgi:hypothetical protein
MRNIYNIYGYDLKNGFCFENIDFSSKKTALDSLAYIREQWMKKLDLSSANVLNIGTTDDEQFVVEIDERIRLTITKKPIYTQVVKYVYTPSWME